MRMNPSSGLGHHTRGVTCKPFAAGQSLRQSCRSRLSVSIGAASSAGPGESGSNKSPGGSSGSSGQKSDYVYDVGKVDYNTNVTTGQNVNHLDSLFTGNFLGHETDIADGSLRAVEFRTYNNIVGDYYVAPRFMEQIAMHLAKNYLLAQDALPGLKSVPLILGVWGPKGTGKSFQTELTFKKMGVLPVIMSAGELEHEWAGTPGRMIRERYRKAADLSRVRGVLSCLVINDLDAGVGRFENTQVTVNNQNVIGTLMNLCDHPESVSLGADWETQRDVNRVPIIVTGNDFSTVYAPLIRDGRMEKFYWEPRDDELVDILFQMYKDDGLKKEDMKKLSETFSNQPLDFFGALRSSTYDSQIRDWISKDVVGRNLDEEADMSALGDRLLHEDGLPDFEPVDLTLEALIKEGDRLAQEQQYVNDFKLSKDYMKDLGKSKGGSMIGLSG